MLIRHNTLTTELSAGEKIGAVPWNEPHEIIDPLSPISGQYYNMGVVNSINGSLALVANQIYLMPLRVRRQITIDRLGIRVATAGAAGNTLRVALYDQIEENGVNFEAGWPGALLNSSPGMDSASPGQREFTLSRVLSPQRQYWAGLWTSAAVTVRAFGTANSAPILSNGSDSATGIGSIWRSGVTYAGGQWPNPFGPMSLTWLTAAQNQAVPIAAWRIA
jgi:hypothetical protein